MTIRPGLMLDASFTYDGNPGRVLFGSGRLDQLPAEVDKLGVSRVLTICTSGREAAGRSVADRLGSRHAGVFAGAVVHVPRATVEAALSLMATARADSIVAIGGGSAIGLAKAVALEIGNPIIAVPTTYSGSEMTPVWGITEAGIKQTGRDRRVQPQTVIYDVDLTLSLPISLSVTSGLNAMAHCVEALYAPDRNPVTSLMASEGISALASGMSRLVRCNEADGRRQCLYGAWLAGCSLASTSMSLHHKLCHTLGGTWNLPHAETHAVILPHALAHNAPFVPEAMATIAQALDSDDAVSGLWRLARSVGSPTSLRDLGFPEKDLPRAADQAVANAYDNPRPLVRDEILALLRTAWAGDPPANARGTA